MGSNCQTIYRQPLQKIIKECGYEKPRLTSHRLAALIVVSLVSLNAKMRRAGQFLRYGFR